MCDPMNKEKKLFIINKLFVNKDNIKMEHIPLKDLVIAIKSAGEIASGIACRLFQANFKHIFMMEIKTPIAVRRQVSFCEAIHDGAIRVEGIKAKKISDIKEMVSAWDNQCIPVLVDPAWDAIKAVHPHVVIDAIIAKKNLGTSPSDARLVIGLGPGFEAGRDVDMVIETNRGHNLGRISTTVSEKARAIGGSVLEAILREYNH